MSSFQTLIGAKEIRPTPGRLGSLEFRLSNFQIVFLSFFLKTKLEFFSFNSRKMNIFILYQTIKFRENLLILCQTIIFRENVLILYQTFRFSENLLIPYQTIICRKNVLILYQTIVFRENVLILYQTFRFRASFRENETILGSRCRSNRCSSNSGYVILDI